MREYLFLVFVLVCVWERKKLKLLTIYLNCLCLLIYGRYIMHFVTRFKRADPNVDTRLGGYVNGGFNDYSLKGFGGLQIMWWQKRVEGTCGSQWEAEGNK